MRISDLSSDVCSSDLRIEDDPVGQIGGDDRGAALQDPEREAVERLSVGRGRGVLYEERSEERRVGKECVSTCRSRWSPAHSKKKKVQHIIQNNRNHKK